MSISANLRLRVYRRDKYRCVECGSSNDLTIDHILPIDKGGSDLFDNLQTMCKVHNMRKGNLYLTTLQKWFPFVTHTDLNKQRSEMLGSMISKDVITTNAIRNEVNNRLNQIEPKIKRYVEELQGDKPTVATGLRNSIEAYGKRSQERDDQLLKIIYLLTDKVEELQKTVDKLS